jgi:hypothetical protein
MQMLIKFVLIVFMFIVGGAILGLIQESRGTGRYGPVGVIVALSCIAGIRAIWNYRSEEPSTDGAADEDQLDKGQ